MKKIAFIGHRKIFADTLPQRLGETIEKELRNGYRSFTMGTHGEFDDIALCTCKKLRQSYPDMEIEVVLTGLGAVDKNNKSGYIPYTDVKTVMYDIEETHFKRRITLSNRRMIDNCDTLICYVDEKTTRSGAKNAMIYAAKKGLRIINLYDEKDKPFYGMTKEHILSYMDSVLNRFGQNSK